MVCRNENITIIQRIITATLIGGTTAVIPVGVIVVDIIVEDSTLWDLKEKTRKPDFMSPASFSGKSPQINAQQT